LFDVCALEARGDCVFRGLFVGTEVDDAKVLGGFEHGRLLSCAQHVGTRSLARSGGNRFSGNLWRLKVGCHEPYDRTIAEHVERAILTDRTKIVFAQ